MKAYKILLHLLQSEETRTVKVVAKNEREAQEIAITSFPDLPSDRLRVGATSLFVEIAESSRHGKCVKGKKLTSTVQVRHYYVQDGYLLEGQFSYKVGDSVSQETAWNKARERFQEVLEGKWFAGTRIS